MTITQDWFGVKSCIVLCVSQPQEPYVFGQEAQAAMRNAMMLRYSLLPFLYTLFHHAHTSASTVARPLFMEYGAQFLHKRLVVKSALLFTQDELFASMLVLLTTNLLLLPRFPSDPNSVTIDRQFLWGSSLLVSPVLEPGVVDLAAYLPPAMWYSLNNVNPNLIYYACSYIFAYISHL